MKYPQPDPAERPIMLDPIQPYMFHMKHPLLNKKEVSKKRFGMFYMKHPDF